MSEKASSKEIEKESTDEIDQSLYSRSIIIAERMDVHFFGVPFGLWDAMQRKKATLTDTNMWCSSQLVSGQEFLIEGIRFKEAYVNRMQREHLLQHAHCIIRIADRDHFIYPYHLMDNFFYYVERRLSIPLHLRENFNFQVILQMDAEFHSDIQLTCELMGKLRRPR